MSVVVLLLTFAIVQSASAQLSGQSFTIVPETSNAAVGDTVTLRFRVRLHERDMLLDSVPRLVDGLSPGVRVLSVEKLSRAADRVLHGQARIAFYRPGRRPVPRFGLNFMRVVEGVPRATLPSDPAFVEIRALLPPGNPALKDIKELERSPGSRLPPLVVALILAAGVVFYRFWSRRRRAAPAVLEAEPFAPVPRSPYDTAVERLVGVEREHWPAQGQVARHYETTANVLRAYLEEAEEVPARERTTSELLWSLPPHLTADGLRSRCHQLLSEADLVKFAAVRPSNATAADFLHRAQGMLQAWHEAAPVEDNVDAIR
ncbi:MAG: hypothetical protein ACREMZ_13980 [Gemmatimonadales bacterium]